MSAKTEHAGRFVYACHHKFIFVGKAPVLSQTRAVLADVQALRHGGFSSMTKKRCSRCGQYKNANLENFPPHKHTRDRLDSWCRECRREKDRARSPEKRRIESAKYRSKNRAACITRTKAWREKNPTYHSEKARQWRRENQEAHLAYMRRYTKENPHRARDWARNNPEKARAKTLRYRARKQNARGTHTAEDILAIYEQQRGQCWWCGAPVGDDYHVDHRIPLSRGGSNAPENLVISCPYCNRSKSNKLPGDFNGRLL